MSRTKRQKRDASAPHRSGFVSILGRPNSGKSTLLNALTGAKLAIISSKPQTTRTTIQGVWNAPGAQVAFMDTPGIHPADSLFNRRMMASIKEALDERDLLLYLIDSTLPAGDEDLKALELIKAAGTVTFAVFNKIDAVPDKRLLLPVMDRYSQWHEFDEYFPVSALTGEGLDDLRAAILARMPEGPAWFPEDYLTDQPERYLAAEIIREKILAATHHEVPHAAAVLIDEWAEEGWLTRVSATIHVERPGQKGIILGQKGQRLRDIGTRARIEIEQLLGRKVFLTLFVKVSPGWRENETFLKELDWRAMLGGEAPFEGQEVSYPPVEADQEAAPD